MSEPRRTPPRPASLAAALVAAASLVGGIAAAAVPPRVWDAMELQEELVRESPSDPALLNDLANLQVLAGQLGAAEATYEQALRLAPESPSIRYNLALLLQETGRLEPALRELGRVVEDDPGNAWAHYQLGTVQHALDKRRAAIESFARAFTLDVQLTFSEINPHVIENPLYMQALLRAFPSLDRRVMAPMTYQEPGRITGLLLAVPEAAEGEGDAGTGEEPGAPRPGPLSPGGGPAGGVTPPETTMPDAVDGGPDAAGAAERDVDPRRPAAYTAPGPPPELPADAAPGDGDRTPAPGAPGTAAPPERHSVPPAQRPRRGDEFRPDPASTGRLELRLAPAEPGAARSAPAR